jgi:hypothetical protein
MRASSRDDDDTNARGNVMSKRHESLQQHLHRVGITRDEKQIRRALRAKFRATHEHNSRWYVTAAVEKFLRSHFARDYENARKRRENAKAKATSKAST